VLNGGDGEEELGSNVPGMDPMRVAGIFLLCLALVVIAVWFARKRGRNLFSGGREQSLSVMENINLGAGRQITIVEMGEYALVLGVTSQSINTLDKVPLTQLSSSYQGTVNSIIARQQNAMPDEWQRNPSFKAPGQLASGLNPAAGSGKSAGTIYGPQGRRVNVGELRRNRAGVRDAEPARPVSSIPRSPQSAQRSKDELIGRVRQQLDRIEH
jgi:flagellar biosynthetic protein FliO